VRREGGPTRRRRQLRSSRRLSSRLQQLFVDCVSNGLLGTEHIFGAQFEAPDGATVSPGEFAPQSRDGPALSPERGTPAELAHVSDDRKLACELGRSVRERLQLAPQQSGPVRRMNNEPTPST